jgi:hypothetical protein
VGFARIEGWLKVTAVGAAFVAMLTVPLFGQGVGRAVFNSVAQDSGGGAGSAPSQAAARGQSRVSSQDLRHSRASQQDLDATASTGTVIKKVILP